MNLQEIKDRKSLYILKSILNDRSLISISNISLSVLILLTCAGSSRRKIDSRNFDINYSLILIDSLNHIVRERIDFSDMYLNREVAYELTYEEKIEDIKLRYNLSDSELDTVLAGCVAEACGDGTNYDDAYAVASTIYNRISSINWTNYISHLLGEGAGNSIYYQFIAPSQFDVYINETYKNHLGRTDLVGYQAAIDMFYSEEPMHSYLAFRGAYTELGYDYETFAERGNKYFSVLEEEDRISKPLSLTLNK